MPLLSTFSFHSRSLSISSSSVSAITAKSSAYSSSHGYMQLICTLLQTDNHTNTSSLNFYSPGALSNANEATIYNSSDYSRVTEFLNINSMLTSKIQTTLPVKCWSPSFVISGQEFKLTDFKHVWCLQHSKVAYYQPIKLWSLTHTCWCSIVVTVTESFVLYKYSHTNWRCITERP